MRKTARLMLAAFPFLVACTSPEVSTEDDAPLAAALNPDVPQDDRGHVLADSTATGRQEFFGPLLVGAGNYIDFLQLPVSSGKRLKVVVSATTVNSLAPGYRLIVVGSTGYLPASDITGAHQVPLRQMVE